MHRLFSTIVIFSFLLSPLTHAQSELIPQESLTPVIPVLVDTQSQISGIFAPPTNTPPVLTLSGANPALVSQGTTYVDSGATATDTEDGTITPTVTGAVNTAVPGTYTRTYTATDSGGQSVTQTRTVAVVPPGPLIPNEVQTIDYYAYGQVRNNTQAGTFNEQKKFTGYEYDTDAGLSYANARYYNQDVGQFVSEDPVFWELGLTKDGAQAVQQPQAQNSYGYAGGNPIGRKDPSGRCSTVAMAVACGLFMPDFESGEPIGSNIYQSSPTQSAENALFIAGFVSGNAETKTGVKSVEMLTSQQKGRIGEIASGVVVGIKEKIRVNGSDRIPDSLDRFNNVLNEVKNVAYQGLTKQLKDYAKYANDAGMQFNLYVAPYTKLSQPLQNMINDGSINLIRMDQKALDGARDILFKSK